MMNSPTKSLTPNPYSPAYKLLQRIDAQYSDSPKLFLNFIPKGVQESEEFYYYILKTRKTLSAICEMFRLSGVGINNGFYTFFLTYSFEHVPLEVHKQYSKDVMERTGNIDAFLSFLNSDPLVTVSKYGKQFIFNAVRKYMKGVPLLSIENKGLYTLLFETIINRLVTTESNWKLIIGDRTLLGYSIANRYITFYTFEFFETIVNSRCALTPDPHKKFWETHSPEEVVKTINEKNMHKRKDRHITKMLERCCRMKMAEYDADKISLENIDDFLLEVYAMRKTVVTNIAYRKDTKAGDLIKNFRTL